MSLPQFSLTDSNNVPITELSFGIIDAGNQSAGIPIRIWNNYAGAVGVSDALNVVLTTKTYNDLDSGDSVQNGNEIVVNQMVQGQCTSAGQTNYTAIGGPKTLSIADSIQQSGQPPPPPTIHAQNFAAVLLSLASAPSATPDNIQFRLSIAFQFE